MARAPNFRVRCSTVINGDICRKCLTASPFMTMIDSMAYPGGKNGSGVYQTIINLMPPHDTYIEPFLGAGAVMRMKRPAAQNIGIDRDPEALAHFNEKNAADPIAKNDDAGSVTVINGDAFDFLTTYRFTGRELVYCDPPYLH